MKTLPKKSQRKQLSKPMIPSRYIQLACVGVILFAHIGPASSGVPPDSSPPPAQEYPPDPNNPDASNPKENSVRTQSASPAKVAQGKQLYKDYCEKCHGLDMVSSGPPFFDLRAFPHHDRNRFVDSVTNGKRAMPAWGAIVKPAEIEAIWTYVSSYER